MIIESLRKTLEEKYKLTGRDMGEFASLKKGPIKFTIESYGVEGVGTLSILNMRAMFGLMKMESFILTSSSIDAPLLSADIMCVGKNNTLLLEMYDTCSRRPEFPKVREASGRYSGLNSYTPAPNWYDSLKLDECTYKKEKIKLTDLCSLASDWFSAYVEDMDKIPVSEKTEKAKRNSVYVEGLLENGGPSTDFMVKTFGKEKAGELFRKYIFGTED